MEVTMKKIITLGFALIMALALSGCMRADTGLQVSEDNTITAHAKIWIDKSQIDAMGDALGSTSDKNDVKVETINGKEYYVEEETKIFTQKDYQKENPAVRIGKDYFYYDIMAGSFAIDSLKNQNTDISDMLKQGFIEYVGMDVTLQDNIAATNGKILDDGKTVHWEFSKDNDNQSFELYAYGKNSSHTLESDSKAVKKAVADAKLELAIELDQKAPVIAGVKNGRTYKKKASIYVKDDVKLKSVKLNGKAMKFSKNNYMTAGAYKKYYKFTSYQKGNNTVTAVDAAGNKKTVKFKIKK